MCRGAPRVFLLNGISICSVSAVCAQYTNVTDRQQTTPRGHLSQQTTEQIEQSFTVYSECQTEKAQRLRTLWFVVSYFPEVGLLFSWLVFCGPTPLGAPGSSGAPVHPVH